jgi:hypothetical protein
VVIRFRNVDEGVSGGPATEIRTLSEEAVDLIMLVRGATLARLWDYTRRRDGYEAAGLDA